MDKISDKELNKIYEEYCKFSITFGDTYVVIEKSKDVCNLFRELVDAQDGHCNVDCKLSLIMKFINEDHGLLESFISSYLRTDNRSSRNDYLGTICALVSIFQKLRCAGKDQLLDELMTVTPVELMVVYGGTNERVNELDIKTFDIKYSEECSTDVVDYYTVAMEYLFTILSYRSYW